ncbi:MFS general substrate transporter [Fusarium oxysporum f. sp. albedinis]|nr:MFS general substrate transporter [Fusarium oxysporum f. sp. albedinis]
MLLFCAVSAFIHLHVSCNTFSLIRLCTRYGEFKGPGSTAQTITGSTQGHDPVLLGNSFTFQVAIFQPLLLADILTIPPRSVHSRTHAIISSIQDWSQFV